MQKLEIVEKIGGQNWFQFQLYLTDGCQDMGFQRGVLQFSFFYGWGDVLGWEWLFKCFHLTLFSKVQCLGVVKLDFFLDLA
jgi:hypothetical protein